MKRRSFLQAAIALGAGARAAWAQSRVQDDSRVALVIGNNAYPQVPLLNAANDARLMSGVLAEAGFKVHTRIDASAESMAKAVREFGTAIAAPHVKLALFYYAGHGAQVDWRNFLLPVDAKVSNAAELRKSTFDLGSVLQVLPKSRDQAFVIILDACRDNPFGKSFHPERQGLSPFDAPLSTIIAFSTSPGGVASDGGGSNGLYTENLARELKVKGLRIEEVFKRVRANVSVASRGAQIPWESTSLVGEVYVFEPPAPLSEEERERQFEEEIAVYARVKGSKDPADWAALLRSFPNGKLSEIAQSKLNLLLAHAAPAAPRSIVKAGELVLGPGLAVPDFLARSENPYSAGTYALNRNFSVGDEAVYVRLDESTKRDRSARRHVTRVDVEGDRVELNGGRFETDLLGNLLRRNDEVFLVPVQIAPAELQVGKRWTARFHAIRPRGEFDEEMSAAIVARERVKVPAGEFDAFRVEAHIDGMQSGVRSKRRSALNRTVDRVIWEVPGLNFPVKERTTLHRRNGQIEVDSLELESLRQKSA